MSMDILILYFRGICDWNEYFLPSADFLVHVSHVLEAGSDTRPATSTLNGSFRPIICIDHNYSIQCRRQPKRRTVRRIVMQQELNIPVGMHVGPMSALSLDALDEHQSASTICHVVEPDLAIYYTTAKTLASDTIAHAYTQL